MLQLGRFYRRKLPTPPTPIHTHSNGQQFYRANFCLVLRMVCTHIKLSADCLHWSIARTQQNHLMGCIKLPALGDIVHTQQKHLIGCIIKLNRLLALAGIVHTYC